MLYTRELAKFELFVIILLCMQVYKCGIMTNFTIELTNLINESLIRQHFSSDMCHFNQCAASILSPPPSVKYFIYILARNQYAENQFTSKIGKIITIIII